MHHTARLRIPFGKFAFNRFIFLLTLSDIFTFGTYTVLSVLAGLYLAQKIEGDVVSVVGIGVSIYWVVRASLQIPLALIEDKIPGLFDEIIFLGVGNFLMGFPFLLYPMIESVGFYYFLQVIFGAGVAFNIISWRKLFVKHLDRNHEGIEYGVYELVMGVAIAFFGIVGGRFASLSHVSFGYVIVAIGMIMMLSSLVIIGLFGIERARK